MATIADLIKNMTLEEKAALCIGAGPWTTTPVERLGIPEMTVTDGPHGVRRSDDVHAFITTSVPATCFPTAACPRAGASTSHHPADPLLSGGRVSSFVSPFNPVPRMLIWRFFHGGPTDWVCKITHGSARKKGIGLSFYYLPDRTTVVSVPTLPNSRL